MHRETCIYVGAIRYFDAVGGVPGPPPPPWVAFEVDEDEKPSLTALAEEDQSIYAKLKDLRPHQQELRITRVVDV